MARMHLGFCLVLMGSLARGREGYYAGYQRGDQGPDQQREDDPPVASPRPTTTSSPIRVAPGMNKINLHNQPFSA